MDDLTQAGNYNGEEIKESEQEANPDAGKENDGIATSADDELERLAVAKALGLNNFAQIKKYSDQIGRIMDWAKLEGADDIAGIVGKINEMQNEIGPHKPIYTYSVYAGLALEKAKLEKQMASFTGK